jgi:GNAT superfamily N-acetyltransferase
MIEVREPSTKQELDGVRRLMRAFVDWHRKRHQPDIALIDRYFDVEAFEAELAALPGKYVRPRGSLLAAYDADQTVGCVAMRDLGDELCEMKRMFVPEFARNRGVGSALVDRIIADARSAGYRTMRLDTSWRQTEAMRLYQRKGFSPIAPYYDLTQDMKDWLRFYELAL